MKKRPGISQGKSKGDSSNSIDASRQTAENEDMYLGREFFPQDHDGYKIKTDPRWLKKESRPKPADNEDMS